MNPTEKRRMIYEIQMLGKKLLAQNGGKDIPFTCVDGRGKSLSVAGSEYNYQLLANAIIEQAADDYFNLVAGFAKTVDEQDRKAQIDSLRKFFMSDWYSLLTKVDGAYLMRKLNEKAETMIIVYTVAHEKGSSLWYVCKPGEESIPLSPRWKTKKRALRKAAEMQGIGLRDYMKVRKRDGID